MLKINEDLQLSHLSGKLGKFWELSAQKIKLIENKSDEKCKLTLIVRLSKIEQLKKELVSLTNGNIKIL